MLSKIDDFLLDLPVFTTTLDTYSHVLPNMQKEVVKAVEGIVKPLEEE